LSAQTVEYRFGRFRLLPDEGRLLVDGEPARLGARALALLGALVERRERAVTRDELFDLVWPGRVVEDQNLKVQVVALRKVLGASAIATIPGRGYRFSIPLDDAPVPVTAPISEQPSRNLPAEPSTLHGRVADIVTVLGLLSEHRIVTVVGPAGIGKTRLAQAVAHQLRARFADGVYLIELAPLADGALVVSTVARALGLGASRETAEDLAGALSSLSLLIALDNCEHVIAAAGQLVAAIRKLAPRVAVVTTSQEPLHIPGEQVFRLGALAVPPGPLASHALDYGAIALFVERAKAADRRFELTSENVAAVIEICRRLDGIPLAIELAAARVPSLGVAGICARLDDRFQLLTRGPRGAPNRHQTLRNALDWSHGLLTTGARVVFRRVGVFAGSFSLASAQRVAAREPANEWTTLDDLAELVDKSLVVADGRDEPRYRLLESTRAYAREALANASEELATRRRHAEATLSLFESADELFMRVPTLEWMQQLAPDLDNWRDAFAFALGEDGDPKLATALVAAAASFLAAYGLAREVARACDRVAPFLERPDAVSAETRARYWLALAFMGSHASVPVPRALEAAKKAAAGFSATGDRLRLYRALHLLSQHADLVGENGSIAPADDEMLRIESPDWPPLLTRLRRQGVARRHRREGRIAEYRDGFAAEARLCAAAGDERAAWILQNHVALAEISLGNLDRAIEVARGVVDQIRRRGMQREFWGQIVLYARVLVERGDAAAALPAVREAIDVLRPQGTLWWLGDHLAWLRVLRDDWINAARLHGWVEARATEHNAPRGPVVKQARDRLRLQLEARFAAHELQGLMDEGAALSDVQVTEIVLERAD
jgi:predicted ATPase/DNA-binding winged helix-turn-helix (wHTH) protein